MRRHSNQYATGEEPEDDSQQPSSLRREQENTPLSEHVRTPDEPLTALDTGLFAGFGRFEPTATEGPPGDESLLDLDIDENDLPHQQNPWLRQNYELQSDVTSEDGASIDFTPKASPSLLAHDYASPRSMLSSLSLLLSPVFGSYTSNDLLRSSRAESLHHADHSPSSLETHNNRVANLARDAERNEYQLPPASHTPPNAIAPQSSRPAATKVRQSYNGYQSSQSSGSSRSGIVIPRSAPPYARPGEEPFEKKEKFVEYQLPQGEESDSTG